MGRGISRREHVKNVISDVALRLLEKKKFEDIRIDELMREAGFTKGTFYQYFDRKESLYEYLIDMSTEKFRMILTSVDETADNPKSAIHLLLMKLYEEKQRNPTLWSLFVSALSNMETLKVRLIHRLWAFVDLWGGKGSYESGVIFLGTLTVLWMSSPDENMNIDSLSRMLYSAFWCINVQK